MKDAVSKLKDYLLDQLTNYVTSLIRTFVPIAAGVLVSWAVRHGINLDQAEVTGYVTPVCIAAYYAIMRFAETKIPKFGWLLGLPKQPGYKAGDVPPPQPPPGGNENI